MNEQRAHYKYSENAASNPLNPALIAMQIQALRESLLRLVDQDDVVDFEVLDNELQEIQSNPNC